MTVTETMDSTNWLVLILYTFWGPGLKSLKGGDSLQVACEVVGHVTPAIRKQRATDTGTHLTLTFDSV